MRPESCDGNATLTRRGLSRRRTPTRRPEPTEKRTTAQVRGDKKEIDCMEKAAQRETPVLNTPLPLSRLRQESAGLEATVRLALSGDGQIGGQIRDRRSGGRASFRNLGELVLALDELCDRTQWPEPWSVAAPPGPWAGWQAEEMPLCVEISVLYRQHGSLQGKLSLASPPAVVPFRSALELMHLISRAVEPG